MRLNELTPEQIKGGPVPMDDLLKDSVYYPASRTDGRPIALCNTVWRRLGVNSFVYCDFDLSEQEFLLDTHTMHGYHVLAHRHLDPTEYIPEGWKLEMAPERGDGRRGGYWDTFLGHGGPEHCACWVVFERNADMSPVHGPERLSVLYVCGEGLATFQQLYCSRGIAPKMLCFIQCWGFAGNWTNFSACGAPFHRTLLKYRESTPEWLCFGDCCGIHGAIRLRNLGYARVRCLGYRTRKALERTAGENLSVVTDTLDRSVLTYSKAGRSFAAVSVSHHMEYAVYDMTRSRFDLGTLLDWLVLTAPNRRINAESSLNAWVGVIGLDSEDDTVPVIDEKLDWRDLDRWPSIAKAIAIVRSVREVYGECGMCAYSRLVKDSMTWARVVLEEASILRLENGLPDLQRNRALFDAREWFDSLPSFSDDVHVNIGFGRGDRCSEGEEGPDVSSWEDDFPEGLEDDDLEDPFDDDLPEEGTPLWAVMEANGILTTEQRARYERYDASNPGCSPENPIIITETEDYVGLEYDVLEKILCPVLYRFVDWRVVKQQLVFEGDRAMDELEVSTHPISEWEDGEVFFPDSENLVVEKYWFDITAGFNAIGEAISGLE